MRAGPSVTQSSSGYSGQDLWSRLNKSFGNKAKSGYGGNKFAVCIGEYGSSFSLAQDLQLHTDLVAYMHGKDGLASGHTPIVSWIFWAWNPSSSDTGGLVAQDWLTINWNKVDKLTGSSPSANDGLNLKPWFYGP